MENSILLSKENNIAYIHLNRPTVFNSFNRVMALSLLKTFSDVEADKSIRAICLSGAGKAFCAGQDLQEATDPNGPGLEIILKEHYNPIILAIRNIKLPVIAAVNGVAAGAGANIALACDIVLASVNASFIQAFSKIALIPDSGGTYFLPRLIGMQRASALMMTGDKIMAQDALQMGLVYKVFDESSFETETKLFVQKIAQMPTQALINTKHLLNQTYANNLQDQLLEELKYQIICGASEDFKEGVNAFKEKRSPMFKGI